MLTIYVLFRYDSDGYEIIDIYNTKEQAISIKRYYEELEKDWEEWEKYQYSIVEYEELEELEH